jgi:hypothetical protein
MKITTLIAAALLSQAAYAADPAPAEAIPPMSCAKPQLQLDENGKLKNGKEVQAQVGPYGKCVDAYVAERKQAVDAHDAAAKANRAAGNAAVTEFNDFADALRAAQGQK